ncbi:TetR family transcriptional regulator [Streptomyces varsoviensis]|uniref:TetR family transcriptional regulator n=1 Tax=Streptomyces varsoviensis TaxID=67373 RepID=A0ABR5IXS7_9ACTN|nr:TetR family transcriptional regulator [Streptomyces varsoviensis]
MRKVTDELPHNRRPALRSDAQDNRARILAAARALFAADGLRVSMREVARHAGVGPATLYRRFPTKQALVDAAFANERRACHAIVDEGRAEAETDPWRGLCLVIEKVCEVNALNHGFTEAFLFAHPDSPEFIASRTYTVNAIAGLARRAKEAGRLRADFVLDDLLIMLMANQGIRAASPADRVAASRRFAALIIQAIQASGERSPLPPAPRLATAALLKNQKL